MCTNTQNFTIRKKTQTTKDDNHVSLNSDIFDLNNIQSSIHLILNMLKTLYVLGVFGWCGLLFEQKDIDSWTSLKDQIKLINNLDICGIPVTTNELLIDIL